jgi:hypothetical protein
VHGQKVEKVLHSTLQNHFKNTNKSLYAAQLPLNFQDEL